MNYYNVFLERPDKSEVPAWEGPPVSLQEAKKCKADLDLRIQKAVNPPFISVHITQSAMH